MAKSKKDIIAELEKLEVEFDEEDTSKNLGELLKKTKEENPEEAPEPPESPEEPETPEESKGKKVSVYGPNKKYIRTFSKSRHGEEYKAKAKEFAGKVEGRKIKEGGPKKGVKEE